MIPVHIARGLLGGTAKQNGLKRPLIFCRSVLFLGFFRVGRRAGRRHRVRLIHLFLIRTNINVGVLAYALQHVKELINVIPEIGEVFSIRFPAGIP